MTWYVGYFALSNADSFSWRLVGHADVIQEPFVIKDDGTNLEEKVREIVAHRKFNPDGILYSVEPAQAHDFAPNMSNPLFEEFLKSIIYDNEASFTQYLDFFDVPDAVADSFFVLRNIDDEILHAGRNQTFTDLDQLIDWHDEKTKLVKFINSWAGREAAELVYNNLEFLYDEWNDALTDYLTAGEVYRVKDSLPATLDAMLKEGIYRAYGAYEIDGEIKHLGPITFEAGSDQEAQEYADGEFGTGSVEDLEVERMYDLDSMPQTYKELLAHDIAESLVSGGMSDEVENHLRKFDHEQRSKGSYANYMSEFWYDIFEESEYYEKILAPRSEGRISFTAKDVASFLARLQRTARRLSGWLDDDVVTRVGELVFGKYLSVLGKYFDHEAWKKAIQIESVLWREGWWA